MDAFFAALLAFPTVLYAGLTGLCLLYWALVVVGAADMDLLDGLTGKAEGALGHAADALAAAKAGAHSAGEALSGLGARTPVTISLSAFSLGGFLGSIVTRLLLDAHVPEAVSVAAALVASLGLGWLSTRAVGRLLQPLFASTAAPPGGRALIGKTCRITIAVDDKGGQAEIVEGGRHVVITARHPGGHIAAGEEAVVVDVDPETGVYALEPLKALLPSEQDAFARATGRAAEASDSVSPSSESGRQGVPAENVPVKRS